MADRITDARLKTAISSVGRATLHALYPKDVEFYLIALALEDSKGNLVDYFSWPILPDSISETRKEITNVRKTMGGVNVLKNPTFVPTQISMRGDFGQRFKVLLNGQNFEFAGIQLSTKSGSFDITPPGQLENTVPQFSSFAKTGYGCIKVLEAMIAKSKKLDSYNKPFSLYLYNPILGNNYQVEVDVFVHSQDSSKYNMFPSYNIQFTSVAPLDSLIGRAQNVKSAIKNVAFSVLQRKANTLVSPIRKALDSII